MLLYVWELWATASQYRLKIDADKNIQSYPGAGMKVQFNETTTQSLAPRKHGSGFCPVVAQA